MQTDDNGGISTEAWWKKRSDGSGKYRWEVEVENSIARQGVPRRNDPPCIIKYDKTQPIPTTHRNSVSSRKWVPAGPDGSHSPFSRRDSSFRIFVRIRYSVYVRER